MSCGMRNRSNRLLGVLLLIALLSSAVVQAIDISQTLTEEKKEVATGTDVLYFIGGGERFILRNADLNTWTQEDAINALPASMTARVTKPFGLLHQGMMLQEGVPLGKQGIKSEVWLVLAPHIRFHDL